jgi:hypothetical protein
MSTRIPRIQCKRAANRGRRNDRGKAGVVRVTDSALVLQEAGSVMGESVEIVRDRPDIDPELRVVVFLLSDDVVVG